MRRFLIEQIEQALGLRLELFDIGLGFGLLPQLGEHLLCKRARDPPISGKYP